MDIGIVGRGRLGSSLAALLRARGVPVPAWGRGEAPSTPIVLLAVPDRAISEAAAVVPQRTVVLHCSGTTPWEVLRPHRPAGSFHPLMTFPGPHALPDLDGVPAAVAGDPEALDAARWLADTLGMRAIDVPGDRRLYHASAVVAGNFATVLLGEAARILAAAGVDPAEAPALLAPLAIQSLKNAAAVGPASALTGPVARGDVSTLDAHRAALAAHGLDALRPLYDILTEHAVALGSDDKR